MTSNKTTLGMPGMLCLLVLGFSAAGATSAIAQEAEQQPRIMGGVRRVRADISIGESAADLYRQVAQTNGFRVIFDRTFKDCRVTVDLDGEARALIQQIARAAGHHYKNIDENTIVIFNDTPQNHREYKELMVTLFVLENSDVREADKMLRSIIEARRLTTFEDLNALMFRDTVDKMAIAKRLIDLMDRPDGETEVAVEVLMVSSKSLDRALARQTASGESQVRLTAKEFSDLKKASGATRILASHLSVIGESEAVLQCSPTSQIELNLDVKARNHPDNGEITLETSTFVIVRLVSADGDKSLLNHTLKSQFRLQNGMTFLVTGIAAGTTPSGESIELVIALTPRVIRVPEFSPGDLESLVVGTESRIEFGSTRAVGAGIKGPLN